MFYVRFFLKNKCTNLEEFLVFYTASYIIHTIALLIVYYSFLIVSKSRFLILILISMIILCDLATMFYINSLTIIIDKQTNNASDKDINDAHQILFKNNPSISILFEIIMPYFDIIRLIIVLSIFAYHGLYIEFMGQEKKVPESIGFISFVFTFLTIIIGFLLDGIVSMIAIVMIGALIIRSIINLFTYISNIINKQMIKKIKLLKANNIKTSDTENEYVL